MSGDAARVLRLGTRGSRLATVQTGRVAKRLEELGHHVEIVTIETAGDREKHLPFAAIGAPGVFVREIERALVDGEIDVAVHSYKDLPTASPEGLEIAAVPERFDPSDTLLARPEAVEEGTPLPLRRAARVGTSSARRAALLAELRPDLVAAPIRGNVPTRVDKLRSGDYDAILLATAGLERLRADGRDGDRVARGEFHETALDPATFTPAPSQGALALQVRCGDGAAEYVAALDLLEVRREVETERLLLRLVEGGCQTAVSAWCRSLPDGELALTAALGVEDGLRRAEGRGPEASELARAVAGDLLRAEPRRGAER